MTTETSKPAVLFVCLGNICRSPLAEAAFRLRAEEAGLQCTIDSCGTAAYHVGQPPDPRSIAEAAKHGLDIGGFEGRQLANADFTNFTHIFAMDVSNLHGIEARQPAHSVAEVALLMDLLPGHRTGEVDDPYYGGDDGFSRTWNEVDSAAQALVSRLTSRS